MENGGFASYSCERKFSMLYEGYQHSTMNTAKREGSLNFKVSERESWCFQPLLHEILFRSRALFLYLNYLHLLI